MSKQKITKEEFLQLLKSYDFINNSIRSFSKLYGVHYNTVTKYLRENDINYNRKESKIVRFRSPNGKFSLSISEYGRTVPLVQSPLQDPSEKIYKKYNKMQKNESIEDKIKYICNSLNQPISIEIEKKKLKK